MYKIKRFKFDPNHPSKTFSLQLPPSYQILSMDGNGAIDVLLDERSGETYPVKFWVVVEGDEVPVETVRFREHIGVTTVWETAAGRGYHVFGTRAAGAFTVSPNLRF